MSQEARDLTSCLLVCREESSGFRRRPSTAWVIGVTFPRRPQYRAGKEFPRPAIEATRRLAKLGHGWFNVSIGESMRMHWPEWGTCDKMVEFLSNLDGSNEQRFGDVYTSVERPPRADN